MNFTGADTVNFVMDSTTPPPVPPKPAKEAKKRIRKPADPSKTKAKKQKIAVPQIVVASKVCDNNDAVPMPKLGFQLTYHELSGAETTVMTSNLKDHVSKLYSTNAASVFQYDDDGTLTLFPLLEGNGIFEVSFANHEVQPIRCSSNT